MNKITATIKKVLTIDLSDIDYDYVEKFEQLLNVDGYEGEIEVSQEDIIEAINQRLLNIKLKDFLTNDIDKIVLKFD